MPDSIVPDSDASHAPSTPTTTPPAPGPTESAERPAWLDTKFATPEQMAIAYAELERKQSGGTADTAGSNPDAAAAAADSNATNEADSSSDEAPAASYGAAVDGVLSSAGIAPADVAAHYEANGTVSEAHYAALEAAGYPKTMVDGYMATMPSAASASSASSASSAGSADDIAAVQAVAGGEAGYKDMIKWAGANLTPAEIASFNAAMDSNDTGLASIAAKDVHAKFTASEGYEPATVITPAGGRPSADVFANHTAMFNAMKAAKLTGDPALIRAVEQKALRSPGL